MLLQARIKTVEEQLRTHTAPAYVVVVVFVVVVVVVVVVVAIFKSPSCLFDQRR